MRFVRAADSSIPIWSNANEIAQSITNLQYLDLYDGPVVWKFARPDGFSHTRRRHQGRFSHVRARRSVDGSGCVARATPAAVAAAAAAAALIAAAMC